MKTEWEAHNSGFQAEAGELRLEYGPAPLMDVPGNGWWAAFHNGRKVGGKNAMPDADAGRRAAETFANNFNHSQR